MSNLLTNPLNINTYTVWGFTSKDDFREIKNIKTNSQAIEIADKLSRFKIFKHSNLGTFKIEEYGF